MTDTKSTATWALGLTWDDLPLTTREATVRTVGNVIGLGVAGTGTPGVVRLRAASTDLGSGEPVIPLLGCNELADPVVSCLVHGTAMHAEDFDDTHLATVLHPGAPIVPVALALGTMLGRSGAEVLTAVAAGVEIGCRSGLSLGRDHFDRGWHVTSTVGRLGAAVTAGHLLRMDASALRTLMAIAISTFAGHTEQLGTVVKPLHPGKAAADVLHAALAIEAGQLGCDDFTDEELVLRAGSEFAGHLDWTRIAHELGSTWEIEQNAFKPYACGIVSHPVIDAGRRCQEAGLTVDDITSVTITVHPAVPAVMGVKQPESGLHSKFSAYHCFAIGVLFGDGGLREFSDEVATRPDIRRLRECVTLVIDEAMPKDACHATVEAAGGTRVVEITHATGSSDNPMATDDLRRKFLGLTRGVLTDPEHAWDTVTGLEYAPDLGALFTATTGAACRAGAGS